MGHLRYQTFKNENAKMEYLNNMRKNRILKVKKRFSELVKYLEQFKDRKSKDRERKIRKKLKSYFLN